MAKRVTLKDIAKVAEVHHSVVGRVLNGSTDKPVAEKTKEKVLKIAKELGYRKNILAARQKTGAVDYAIIHCRSVEFGFHVLGEETSFNIQKNLTEQGAACTSFYLNDSNIDQIRQSVDESLFCGVVFLGSGFEELKQEIAKRIPALQVFHKIPNLPSLLLNMEDGAKKLVSFLKEKKVSKVRLISMTKSELYERRMELYQKALQADSNLEIECEYISNSNLHNTTSEDILEIFSKLDKENTADLIDDSEAIVMLSAGGEVFYRTLEKFDLTPHDPSLYITMADSSVTRFFIPEITHLYYDMNTFAKMIKSFFHDKHHKEIKLDMIID